MRKLIIGIMMMFVVFSCKKFIDVNSDPDTTQNPSNSSVLPAVLASIPSNLQVDGLLYVAKYTQNWLTGSASNANVWDQQGYTWASGTAAAAWTMTYVSFGKNLSYLIDNAEKENQPEFKGVALALRAYAFQHTTDYNSDIIFHDAFKDNLFSFRYEGQDTVYQGIDSICKEALANLNQAIVLRATTVSSILAKGDYVYSGDLLKWKKFVFGILARNYGHIVNKADLYKPDSVIAFVDSSFGSVDDDFVVPFDATQNNNSNYYGTFRDNMGTVRQSNFIVGLLDGTALARERSFVNRDPRIAYMLVCSNDTTNGNGGYRGVDPGVGDPYYALSPPSSYVIGTTNYNNARKKIPVFWGDSIYVNPSANSFNDNTGKYLFKNKSVFPVMTYAELQFVKAEAAYKKGERDLAYQAYLNGIKGHFSFINRSYSGIKGAVNLYNTSPISSSSMNTYLQGKNVKQNAGDLSLSDIMLQKYIAMWGWGFVETWVDLRKYHYLDTDPKSGDTVYRTFNLPAPLYSLNNNLPVQRVRPHFTSEYTYNYNELLRVGALRTDYHTKEMWFSKSNDGE
jgi:hypothetical protein